MADQNTLKSDSSKREEPQPPPKSIFRRIGLNLPFLEYKTPFERSEYSCAENILRGTSKSFGIALGLKWALALLGIVFNLRKLKKDPLLLFKRLGESSHFKIAFFVGSMTFLLKTTIALMRIIRKKDDGYNGAVAGFVAGYLSMFVLKQKKVFLACLMLARGIECIYNSIADKGHYKRSNVHWVVLYTFLMLLIGYSYAHERYLTDPGAIRGFDFVTNQNDKEWQVLNLYAEMTRRRLSKNGIHTDPFLIEG